MFFSSEDAAFNAAAEMIENDDEGWFYEVARKGNNYRIAVYDEEHVFVDYL